MKSKMFLLTGMMAIAASAATVEISSPDGGRAVADTYGARLISWRPAGGEEVFAMPKPYDKCPRKAGVQTHGGLPVYWPWFVFEGPEGCKIHGVTSYAEWKVKDHTASRVVFDMPYTPGFAQAPAIVAVSPCTSSIVMLTTGFLTYGASPARMLSAASAIDFPLSCTWPMKAMPIVPSGPTLVVTQRSGWS